MSDIEDFLAMPMYRLVDRHRAILEKIKTREDSEYWGQMLIGEYYPDVPNSRSASGKMAALVGLTDYMDFYCRFGYYDLLKKGKTLEEARKILGERMAKNIREFIRLVDSEKDKKRTRGKRSEGDKILDPDLAKPADVIKRRTHRQLMDFAGMLSPETAEELRNAIEEARKEREPLDRERLKRLMEAFDRSNEAAVLNEASRRAKSAGLTRKKARDLLDQVKKEAWNRTYGDKKRGE